MLRSLFIIAGELSSDRYAARLVTELRERIPGLRVEAVGGPNLKAAGVPLFRDSSQWSAIGIAEAFRRILPIWTGHRAVKRRLKADPPDLLVLLDFGAFNVPTGNFARRWGIPVVYAVPPGSWRPDGGRVSAKLAACADGFLTPFEPSERTLRAAGLDAHWMGHPLLDFLPDAADREGIRRRLDSGQNGPVVAILPGSRGQELQHLAPVMLDTAKRMAGNVAGLRFVIPRATSLKRDRFEQLLQEHGWAAAGSPETLSAEAMPEATAIQEYAGPAPLYVLEGRAIEALAAADAAMICSGTATLEAALVGCPMVISYHGGSSMALEYMIRKAVVPKYIGLPNLLLDRELCPELIHENCTPERLEERLMPLLDGGEARRAQQEGFEQLRTRLGEPGVISRWADFIAGRWGDGAPTSGGNSGGEPRSAAAPAKERES
ncbi:MAG: hypothetical protein KY468_00475 [Armatimonadetes bacterium]|nr:hypothetical protein [Armatimonadota bacterium]